MAIGQVRTSVACWTVCSASQNRVAAACRTVSVCPTVLPDAQGQMTQQRQQCTLAALPNTSIPGNITGWLQQHMRLRYGKSSCITRTVSNAGPTTPHQNNTCNIAATPHVCTVKAQQVLQRMYEPDTSAAAAAAYNSHLVRNAAPTSPIETHRQQHSNVVCERPMQPTQQQQWMPFTWGKRDAPPPLPQHPG
jgi:hypothetical protein